MTQENLQSAQKKVNDFMQIIGGNPYIAGAFQDVISSLNVLIDEKDNTIKTLESKIEAMQPKEAEVEK